MAPHGSTGSVRLRWSCHREIADVTKFQALEAPRPKTMPSVSSTAALKFRKNRNSFKSISMVAVCRTNSGINSSSSPSCLKTRYGDRLRLPTWVSTDTSAKLPAQEEIRIRSIAARPPFFCIWAFALSLRVICIRLPQKPSCRFTPAPPHMKLDWRLAS